MLTLAHYLIENSGLMAQEKIPCGRVEAELERDRRNRVEMWVTCLPHLSEAALAEQFDQLPIHICQRPVSRPESGDTLREEPQEVFGVLHAQTRG